MKEIDGKVYYTQPEMFAKLMKDMKDSAETNKKLADELNDLKPFIRGVVDFISDENVDCLSKVQLFFKIGEHLNKNKEKGE